MNEEKNVQFNVNFHAVVNNSDSVNFNFELDIFSKSNFMINIKTN
jgi:hypothetical protein